MVTARIATLEHGRPMKTGQLASLARQPEAAARLNIAEHSVRRARVVIKHGTPELIAAVERA
jgi:hypothetical protein